MLSMKLIGFLMLAVRHEAISQILGLLVLENGIFLGAQILVPGMPLLIEIVILFDLLIVVACFGLLVQYLMTHVGTHQQPRNSGVWWVRWSAPLPSRSSWRRALAIVLIVLTRQPKPGGLAESRWPASSRLPPQCRCPG